ncbi:MAG: hypothetical protein LBK66_15105 [Spirochaetaceae bacterium]|nr:hypothetical protein [Spirochaetaceae bacterium]
MPSAVFVSKARSKARFGYAGAERMKTHWWARSVWKPAGGRFGYAGAERMKTRWRARSACASMANG